jgi:hypothetical protein
MNEKILCETRVENFRIYAMCVCVCVCEERDY